MSQQPERGEASASCVVAGVMPDQPGSVVSVAATFAERFDLELVCVWVDASEYPVGVDASGAMVTAPIDPDLEESRTAGVDPALRRAISAELDQRPVRWSIRTSAGGPAYELARVADELDAAMIVVGTHEGGVLRSLHEFFNGSVAVHLAHRQYRPVVVVPLDPVTDAAELPWQVDDE